jgi:hypothetical protein
MAESADAVIADIGKNSRELLRVQVREFKGHRFADIRVHYRDGEDIKPSGKGVTAKAEQIDQLIDALQQAKTALSA